MPPPTNAARAAAVAAAASARSSGPTPPPTAISPRPASVPPAGAPAAAHKAPSPAGAAAGLRGPPPVLSGAHKQPAGPAATSPPSAPPRPNPSGLQPPAQQRPSPSGPAVRPLATASASGGGRPVTSPGRQAAGAAPRPNGSPGRPVTTSAAAAGMNVEAARRDGWSAYARAASPKRTPSRSARVDRPVAPATRFVSAAAKSTAPQALPSEVFVSGPSDPSRVLNASPSAADKPVPLPVATTTSAATSAATNAPAAAPATDTLDVTVRVVLLPFPDGAPRSLQADGGPLSPAKLPLVGSACINHVALDTCTVRRLLSLLLSGLNFLPRSGRGMLVAALPLLHGHSDERDSSLRRGSYAAEDVVEVPMRHRPARPGPLPAPTPDAAAAAAAGPGGLSANGAYFAGEVPMVRLAEERRLSEYYTPPADGELCLYWLDRDGPRRRSPPRAPTAYDTAARYYGANIHADPTGAYRDHAPVLRASAAEAALMGLRSSFETPTSTSRRDGEDKKAGEVSIVREVSPATVETIERSSAPSRCDTHASRLSDPYGGASAARSPHLSRRVAAPLPDHQRYVSPRRHEAALCTVGASPPVVSLPSSPGSSLLSPVRQSRSPHAFPSPPSVSTGALLATPAAAIAPPALVPVRGYGCGYTAQRVTDGPAPGESFPAPDRRLSLHAEPAVREEGGPSERPARSRRNSTADAAAMHTAINHIIPADCEGVAAARPLTPAAEPAAASSRRGSGSNAAQQTAIAEAAEFAPAAAPRRVFVAQRSGSSASLESSRSRAPSFVSAVRSDASGPTSSAAHARLAKEPPGTAAAKVATDEGLVADAAVNRLEMERAALHRELLRLYDEDQRAAAMRLPPAEVGYHQELARLHTRSPLRVPRNGSAAAAATAAATALRARQLREDIDDHRGILHAYRQP